jgi:hypothetical protein
VSHDDTPRLPITSIGDLLAAVPYLIGFHPTDSLVIIGLANRTITVASRTDLPRPADVSDWTNDIAAQQLTTLHQAAVTTTIIIGYGPATHVTPAVDAVSAHLRAARIDIRDALRVTDSRYFSYLCHEPGCCPADGVPFDSSSSAVTMHAIVAGHSALPDRGALVASVAPIQGAARDAMTLATMRARARRHALATEGGRTGILRAGEKAVRETFHRYADERVLTDDEVAWLTVLLPTTAVRDVAWRATDSQPWHIALWSDITRRAQPHLAAPPASLLAFAAWRSGAGALASVAIDRALQANPTYSLAQLLDRALREGLPPSVLDGWPSPQGSTTTP